MIKGLLAEVDISDMTWLDSRSNFFDSGISSSGAQHVKNEEMET